MYFTIANKGYFTITPIPYSLLIHCRQETIVYFPFSNRSFCYFLYRFRLTDKK